MAKKKESYWTLQRISILAFIGIASIALVGITVVPAIELHVQNNQQAAQKEIASKQCGAGEGGGPWQDPNPVSIAAPKFVKPKTQPVKKLTTIDIKQGNGEAVKATDCVRARYIGWTVKDGKVFDGNFDKKVPSPHVGATEFSLSQVIPGWTQGVVGIKVGGSRRIIIPAELAYGKSGKPPVVQPNADLEFVVNIVAINHDAPPVDTSPITGTSQ